LRNKAFQFGILPLRSRTLLLLLLLLLQTLDINGSSVLWIERRDQQMDGKRRIDDE